MAGIAFKQPCPSCDHPILIRDAALVGKKILCPKCKYGFVVQKSAGAALDDTQPSAKSGKTPTAKPSDKPGALRVPVDEPEIPVAPNSDARRKRMMGLVLGGVGLVVLLLAAYVILGPKAPTKTIGRPTPKDVKDVIEDDDSKKPEVVQEKPKEKKKIGPAIDEPVLAEPGPELTNLLPPDTEHVFHGFFRDLFYGPLGEHVIGDRAIADGAIKPYIGFAVAEIDDIIRADRLTDAPWTFTVIHLHAIVDQKLVVEAFGLKAMPPIKGHVYFAANKPNPRFDRLSHIALGVPQWLRTLTRDDARPMFVRFHNPQTLIVADEAPMKALLDADLRFKIQSADGDGKDPLAKADKKAELLALQTKPYLTIKPKLKDALDRLESKPEGESDKPIYSTVTELEPARVPNDRLPPSDRGKFFWRGKQVWDPSNLLEERKARIVVAGSSVMQHDAKNYQYRAEFECDGEREARNVLRLADDVLAPELARNAERYLRLKIEIPRAEATPNPKGAEAVVKDASRWTAALRENSVDIRIDLVFDNATLSRVQNLLNLFALTARAEVGLAADARGRHLLGQAAVKLAETGNADRKIPAGSFPPGAFNRPAAGRGGNSPYERLGWMASLLPYLGHANLANRIDYNLSWREPGNWMAARTIVPEFLDPSYPDSSRFVMVPGMGVAPATTHVVGIVGVGLDAADYDRADPAFAAKRGVFGYDRSASLDDLKKGRGASNVIMMMQIPQDGFVSPWIAGGGATLRGVPEKNSLAPFVLSTDKTGKPITNNGKRGTYAIMADGSVRFLDANTPDDVVKALCTVAGPAPQVDFFKDSPIIPDPAAPKPAEKPKALEAPKTATPRPEQKLETAPMPSKAPAIDEKKK